MFARDLDEEEGPYVLVQRQFESPDGGRCYVETHEPGYVGHFRIAYAELGRNRFFLKLSRATAAELEVVFNTTEENWGEVARVMRIMIPRLKILDPNPAY